MRERACGVLRRGVDRDLVVLDTTGGTRRLRGHQDRQHRDVGPASGGADRAQHHVRASPRQRLEEDRDDRVHARVGRHRLDRPAEVRARGGGEHVDRVRQCRCGRQVIGERPASVLRERLDPQAGRHAGIDAGDRRSAGVGDDRHAVAPWQRLVREQLGDVELLVQGLDADDARVVEERVDAASEACSRAPVCDDAARRPAALRPLLTTITGLDAVSRRQICAKRWGFPSDSRYRRTTSVPPSCSQKRRKSLLDRSALLPIETNDERPRPRRAASSSAAIP